MLPFVTYSPKSGAESALDDKPVDPEALSEFSRALQLLQTAQARPGVMSTVEDPAVGLLQSFMAEKMTEANRLQPAAGATLEAKFDERDLLGWAGSFFTWWRRLRPHPWLTAPATPDTVPSTFRLALFGDWATGLYGAPVCAKTIAAGSRPDVVLHLGDTYYSGTDDEMNERLIAFWPEVTGALNRTCNGNHEMYTGGDAYFKHALAKFSQPASYFAMQNDRWLLVGLDTAYADHDLHGDQVAWLEGLVSRAGDRKLILFSHHQPFSLLDSQGPKLVAKLANLLSAKRIFAWYWGHEHHCVLYEAHRAWGLLGRCVGHGGFPYFREEQFGQAPDRPTWRRLESKNLVPAAIVLDGQNPYVKDHEKEYGPHGYATLEFEGGDVFETINDADGTVLRAQPLM
jgi:hypothetical protein